MSTPEIECRICGLSGRGRFCSNCGAILEPGEWSLNQEAVNLLKVSRWLHLARDLIYAIIRPAYLSRQWIAGERRHASPLVLLLTAVSVSFAITLGLVDRIIALFGQGALEGTMAYALRPYFEPFFPAGYVVSDADPVRYMFRHRLIFVVIGLPSSILIGSLPIWWMFARACRMTLAEAHTINLYTRSGIEVLASLLLFAGMMSGLLVFFYLMLAAAFAWPVVLGLSIKRIYPGCGRWSVMKSAAAYVLIQIGMTPVLILVSILALYDSELYDWLI